MPILKKKTVAKKVEVKSESAVCVECKGTGRNKPEQTCPRCGGTGK